MLLGRNGAGKTTTLRTIMGLWQAPPADPLRGDDIEPLATPDIARLGIGYVPESMGIFSDLTVKENLMLAARAARSTTTRLEWIFGFFPALKKILAVARRQLSGGQKQMLSIARAIVEPRKLLLIDEPTKGLAPAIVDGLIDCFRELKRRGATILLVEQNFPCRARSATRCGDGQRQDRPPRRDGGAGGRRGAAGAAARPQPGGASVTDVAATRRRAAGSEAGYAAGAAAPVLALSACR